MSRTANANRLVRQADNEAKARTERANERNR